MCNIFSECDNVSEFVRIFQNVSEFVIICRNVPECVRIFQNVYECVRKCQNVMVAFVILGKILKIELHFATPNKQTNKQTATK
jgi:hypothetical protein